MSITTAFYQNTKHHGLHKNGLHKRRQFFLHILILVSLLVFTSCTKKGSGGDDSVDGGGNSGGGSAGRNACGVLGLNTQRIGGFDLVSGAELILEKSAGFYPRIISGTECEPGDSAVVRLIVDRTDGTFTCTGSMLTKDRVLTAAHCAEGEVTNIGVAGGFGFSKVANVTDIKTLDIEIQPATGRILRDAAIATLDRPLNLPTLPLINSVQSGRGDVMSIFGFGLAEDESSGRLRSGQMVISEVGEDGIFAQFTEGGSNTCSGDSGGPALKQVKLENGESITGIVGITSSGERENCELGDISFFTNVQDATIRNFITSNAPGTVVR
jgi:hypothetical protein